MQVPTLNPKVKAADIPLERLATSSKITEKEKIAEASRQFEAVLLRQIMAEGQKPLMKSSLFPSGNTSNAIYQDMITQQMADRISQGGSFGFAKALQTELTLRYVKKDPAPTKPLALVSTVPSKEADFQLKSELPHVSSTRLAPKKYITVTPQPGKRI